MPGFIHGELNWSERVAAVRSHVHSMLDAVAPYPWGFTEIQEVSAHSPSCVLGRQDVFDRVAKRGDTARTVMIVADIQIHSRDDLIKRLEISASDGAAFGDDDLVTAAYHKWGLDFVDVLLGEGAFAIWEPSRNQLICWRDAGGVRPFYFHHRPGERFVFSSDLQSIAAHPKVPPHLDLEYANSFLRSESFQHPTRTLLSGVAKLPAGHFLVVDHNGVRIQRHWNPDSIVDRKDLDDHALAEELVETLRSAIDDRLASHNHGVAGHVSGGLDSSSIALTTAAMLEGEARELTTLSWSPPRDVVPALERDERDLVEAAAESGGLTPRYTRLSPNDVVDLAYRDVALRPRATLNFEVATSRNAAAAGARMIFSGWGGDEMIAFNGRGYFADLARRGRLATLERELRLRSRIQGGTLRGAWKSRVFVPLSPGRRSDSSLRDRPPLPGEIRSEFADALASTPSLEHEYPRERPGVHRMQTALFDFGHLQFRMESWAAHGASLGLVYTFPLLDRRIMEMALSLPGQMFFRDGWKRWLYRTAMKGVLPDVIRWNPMKYDDAAAEHLRAVRREPAEIYLAPLLDQQNNPLIDVNVIVAEQERMRHALSIDREEPAEAGPPIGAGAWLAFTQLRPA